MSGAEEEQPTSAVTTTDASDGKKEQTGAPSSTAAESHLLVPASIRQRFLVFIEQLVKDSIDENRAVSERPIMISSELFNFVNKSVPVPNIQDEYRRKIFLLVNVAEDPETARRRKAEQLEILLNSSRGRQRGEEKEEKKEVEATGGAEDIPAELRFLVSSLPLTLSPWASVMILREVIAESAGNNPRYTYVLNAAIDLQLPISTTRSRIATTVNMWRFLSTQTQKLSLKESLLLKQRCLLNLPLAYILSSYWSLLAWTSLACLTLLNVFGIDYESQLVANTLFQKFAPFEEIDTFDVAEDANRGGDQPWQKEAAADLASNYLEQDELSHQKNRRSASNIVLSSASYLFLGYDDQRRPMTIVTIQSNPKDHRSGEEEYSAAAAILRELSLHVPFPFFLDIERPLSHNLLVARIAERIRRVSFNNTWFVARLIIRTFPLGREYTERTLVSHTCAQANLTRRRVTFLFYIHPGVPVTPAFLRNIHSSFLCDDANVVLVVHEESLLRGNVTPGNLDSILRQKGTNTAEDRCRVIPFSKELFSLGLIKQSVSWPASRLPKSSTREKVSSRVPKEGSDAGFWTGAIQPVWTPIKGFFQSDEKKDVPKTTDKKVEKEEGQLKKYLVPVPLGVLRETMYAIPSAAGIGSPFQSADPENNKR
ncbi:hypothetical protein, conserved [Angomonas deanei]|uniref:Uncharacterized protein n=1 Tax=Angomonas deanei TaxID=59799 RepID=A0A7G2C291_9TRYP|nr:hypothetical protein, conserved [Angomonas deanei]